MVSDSALKRVLATLGPDPKAHRVICDQAQLTKDHCKKCLDILIELGLAEKIKFDKAEASGNYRGWNRFGYKRAN